MNEALRQFLKLIGLIAVILVSTIIVVMIGIKLTEPPKTPSLPSDSQASVEEVIRITVDGQKLDWEKLTKGLPLTKHKWLRSGNNRKKQWARIKTVPEYMGSIELIGNDQKDADLFGGNCNEFDKQGNSVWPWKKDGPCYTFFTKLMGNVSDTPEALRDFLIADATRKQPVTGELRRGDLSFELSRDSFFFIRRWSRIDNAYKNY